MVDDQAVDRVLGALPGSPQPVGDPVLGFDALSMSFDADYAVGDVGGWTVVSDPRMQAVWTSGVRESLAEGDRRVLGFVVDDLTTTHGFAWYKSGQLVRSAVYVNGEPVEQAGDPLPEEDQLPDTTSEDLVPVLAQRLTGLGMGELLDASYTVLHNGAR